MKESDERTADVSPPDSRKQSSWVTVLDLGVITGQHEPGMDKADVQRSSGFISMP